MNYLLDSDVVIYAARSDWPQLTEWVFATPVVISRITELEALGFHRLLAEDKLFLETFFSKIRILTIEDDLVKSAVRFRQMRKMSVGDAIIAATAARYRLPLVTNNHRDYAGLPGLEVLPLASLFAG